MSECFESDLEQMSSEFEKKRKAAIGISLQPIPGPPVFFHREVER